MEYHPDAKWICLRRLTAALIALVVTVTSLSSTALPYSSLVRGQESVAEFVKPSTTAPKPCQRAALPGAINTCHLAGLGLSSIPSDEAGYAMPDFAVGSLSWRIRNSRQLAQCSGSSPYRPPCLIA